MRRDTSLSLWKKANLLRLRGTWYRSCDSYHCSRLPDGEIMAFLGRCFGCQTRASSTSSRDAVLGMDLIRMGRIRMGRIRMGPVDMDPSSMDIFVIPTTWYAVRM